MKTKKTAKPVGAEVPVKQQHDEPLVVRYLPVDALDAHPENRDVKNGNCENLAASIAARGICDPLTVRVSPSVPGRFQIVAGHRRTVAARMAGLAEVPALVRELSDLDALELVLVSNLEREGLDPDEEARGVRALAAAGLDMDQIVSRLHRSRPWVQMRLALGDLPMPMREAIRDRRVALEVVADILRVPEEQREEAVQLVLHPTYQSIPLNTAQAKAALEKEFIEPAARAAEWEKGQAKRIKAWKKKLAGAEKMAELPAKVEVLAWDGKLPGGHVRYALDVVDYDLTEEAPAGLTVAAVAIRHGHPVFVVPAERFRWLCPGAEEDWSVEDTPVSLAVVVWSSAEEAEDAITEDSGWVRWLGGGVAAGADGDEEEAAEPDSYRSAWSDKHAICDRMAVELAGAFHRESMFTRYLGLNVDQQSSDWAMHTAILKYLNEYSCDYELAARVAGIPWESMSFDEALLELVRWTDEAGWPEYWMVFAQWADQSFRIEAYMMGMREAGPVLSQDTILRVMTAVELLGGDVESLKADLPELGEIIERSIGEFPDWRGDDARGDDEE